MIAPWHGSSRKFHTSSNFSHIFRSENGIADLPGQRVRITTWSKNNFLACYGMCSARNKTEKCSVHEHCTVLPVSCWLSIVRLTPLSAKTWNWSLLSKMKHRAHSLGALAWFNVQCHAIHVTEATRKYYCTWSLQVLLEGRLALWLFSYIGNDE